MSNFLDAVKHLVIGGVIAASFIGLIYMIALLYTGVSQP